MKLLHEQTYPAATEQLGDVRAAVRAACQQAGCNEECSGQVVLAVNEACMNVIQHGYGFADGQSFALRLAQDGTLLVVQLLDNGPAVRDADLKPRALDDLRPGGLGVRFMRELMDEVAYLAAPAGFTNCLQMRKRIS